MCLAVECERDNIKIVQNSIKKLKNSKVSLPLFHTDSMQFVVMNVKYKDQGNSFNLPSHFQPLNLSKRYSKNGDDKCDINYAISAIKRKADTPTSFYLKSRQTKTFFKLEVTAIQNTIKGTLVQNSFVKKSFDDEKEIKWNALDRKEFKVFDDVLKETKRLVQSGQRSPPKFYVSLSGTGKSVIIEVTREKAYVTNKGMPKDWSPSKEDIDYTQKFWANNKCSVMYTLKTINLMLNQGEKLPPKFYIKSSRSQSYYKIEVRYKVISY